jgi:hypothetical protein
MEESNDFSGTNGGWPSRWISSLIAAGYIIGASASGVESALTTILFCVIPLACIWFPDALADYTGMFILDSITRESPPFLVWFLGWLVLLMPALVAGIVLLEGIDPHAILH